MAVCLKTEAAVGEGTRLAEPGPPKLDLTFNAAGTPTDINTRPRPCAESGTRACVFLLYVGKIGACYVDADFLYLLSLK